MSIPNSDTTDSPADSYYFGAPHLRDLNSLGPYHPTTYVNLYSNTNPGPSYRQTFRTINGVTEVLHSDDWVDSFLIRNINTRANNPISSGPTFAATATSILTLGLSTPIPTHVASVPFAALLPPVFIPSRVFRHDFEYHEMANDTGMYFIYLFKLQLLVGLSLTNLVSYIRQELQ
ncbi:Protein of unknown function [Pyronema omphalodes CBS 100304]|uniref:Uncharacterized protein n=1 Tax=Pyronema omphalodes (strain CBS 100304) TaxID=1076935 RepID=U4LFD6_PYROM|nr:Protein of unknown function [Pyronema omphalodes CBS 100304]